MAARPQARRGNAIRLTLPRLHIVSNDAVLARPDFMDDAAAMLAHGGAEVAMHLRALQMPARRLWSLAAGLALYAERSGAHLVINDRIDIALACGASGVHLGERAMTSLRARSLSGSKLTIGRSVHTVDAACEPGDGTDYVFLGTILPSRSHADAVPLGLGAVAVAARVSRFPVIAIGGIGLEQIADLSATGAWGVAMIAAVWDARDRLEAMQSAIRALRGFAERRGQA
jgi:thiamine-phosphate pyrophosphorylase